MEPELPIRAKGVFFDLYGTLLVLGDMKMAWADWMQVFYEGMCEHGLCLGREDFGRHCERFFGRSEPSPVADGLTVFERRIHRLAGGFGLTVETDKLKTLATRAVNAWQAHVSADPEALEILRVLTRTKSLALISNFDHPPHARQVLRETGLDACFHTIVVSGEVGIKKPDPGIFRIALKSTGLAAEEVIYLGDTQEDVEGATAAGIRPILIVRPTESSQPRILDYTQRAGQAADGLVSHGPGAVTTIASLRELPGILTTD
jgi:HAD superfamily hydrolase (TIGR01549 family)